MRSDFPTSFYMINYLFNAIYQRISALSKSLSRLVTACKKKAVCSEYLRILSIVCRISNVKYLSIGMLLSPPSCEMCLALGVDVVESYDLVKELLNSKL